MTAPPEPGHQAVAKVLRHHPPVLDELSRARLERAVVETAHRELPALPEFSARPRRRALKGAMVAGGLTAAAVAAVVAVWVQTEGSGPKTGMDSFDARSSAKELMEASLVAEGMPAQGETLRTASGQRMQARIGASEVQLEPNTHAQFERIAPEELRVRLHRGALHVAFHPSLGTGQEMVVTTRAARVEVVGTVFRVEVDGAGATGVWVEEGEVRVVPQADVLEPQILGEGESTRVDPAGTVPVKLLADEEATEPEAAESRDDDEAGEEAAEGRRERAEPAPSRQKPAAPSRPQRKSERVRGKVLLPGDDPSPAFGRARQLLNQQRYEAARRSLRRVTEGDGRDRGERTRAWVMIAQSYEEQGNYREAAGAYGKASWFGTRTQAGLRALFMLGRLREGRLGDTHGARNAYERYLQRAPRGPHAPQARQALCRLGSDRHCP